MTRPIGVLLVLITLLGVPLKAQLSSEFTGMNNLKKQKWEKAKLQFNKVLVKDTLNSGALYGLSIYHFSPSNPNYQIDSAYQYVVEALLKYPGATLRHRDRWRKIPMDSLVLIRHRERIDSAAFERALKINSEDGYIDFANRFPTASQKTLALELRDEVAYLDALRVNTYQSFLGYLNKYPNAARASEAKFKYEKLLFETKTKDKRLISYESFLLEYPSTPYRKNAEQQIFEILTASGSTEDFMIFLKKYPESSKVSTARNILFHILKEEDKPFQSILNDSISKIEMLGKMYLAPFLKGGKFGFMNERGEDILLTDAEEIDKSLRCGNIMDDLIVLDTKIMARNGVVIYDGKIDEVEDLGYGFLKVTTSTCVKVIHYSGLAIEGNECFQDATLLGNNYLAIQKKNKWGLWTLTGRMLLPFDWDEIVSVASDAVAFAREGKFKLASVKEIAKIADQLPVKFQYTDLDEVKRWPDGNIWIRIGNKQAVLNQDLSEWIAMDKHSISLTFFGAVSQNDVGYTLHSKKTEKIKFTQVKMNNSWVAGKSEVGWQLWSPNQGNQMHMYDSIGFLGPMAVGLKEDSMRVHLPENVIETLRTAKPHFLAGKDSVYFLIIEEADKKRVFNSHGEMLFLALFDKVEYNNEGFFTVYKKEKKGLISPEGKLVVQPEYDALGTVTDGVVTVLKEKKFGLLNVRTRQQIKTEYEKNLVKYSAANLIAFKNGFYALIRWDNRPVTPFEFEEIKYWNDSLALVKKNFNWVLYNFIEKKVVLDQVKKFKWVVNTEQEKIIIFQQENDYGVLSNKRGVIIAPTFSDIINLGSTSVPLYFTEKHVEEAGIYVVIYYDKDGNQLRKQVFETDDYEKIYCNRNN